jgi:folate-binding protein YgfZ
MLIDVDCTDVEPLLAAIDHHVFSEDVQVAVDEDGYTLELHGPDAERVLGACASVLPDLGRSNAGVIAGRPIRCTRNDVLGVPGVRIHVHREDAAAIWETLHARGRAVVTRCRTAGWYAVNIARVEAASPWWHVDYGPTTVPHETGLLQSHVDFDKGCYPGQEVVARMEYLGNPKQILRRIIVADERLPIAGGQIFGGDDASLGDPIGVITSSSPAPMRGNQAVAMGMVKWSSAAVGTPVRLVAEGAAVRGTIEEIEVPE